jgi:hypothetical protein
MSPLKTAVRRGTLAGSYGEVLTALARTSSVACASEAKEAKSFSVMPRGADLLIARVLAARCGQDHGSRAARMRTRVTRGEAP